MLEELLELGFSWIKIGEMLGVSRWTIHRRIEEYGLPNMAGFHHMPDEEQHQHPIVEQYSVDPFSPCFLLSFFFKF